MKKTSILTLMIVLATLCFAQNPPRVVVLPLENRAGEQYEKDAGTLSEILSTFINETLRLNVIDHFTLDAAMAARRWRMDDWADNTKTAEMGRALNASYIVRGTVTALGNSLIISVRILDIATAELKGSTNTQLENLAEAYSKLNSLAQILTYNLGLPMVQQAQQVQTAQPLTPPVATAPPPEPAQPQRAAASAQILATFGFGGQFLDNDTVDWLDSNENETVDNGTTAGVNIFFVGKSGFTISAGTDVVFVADLDGGMNADPVIGFGYVYYNKLYLGGILNVIPKPYPYHYNSSTDSYWYGDVYIVPTFVAGYDFGGFLLSGQLSYMRGVMSSVNGFKFSIGAGVNVGRSW